MFNEKQIAELQAPLNRSNVSERKQGGRMLSFVEGWWVISEANRIFGFDGWTSETIEFKCVSEGQRRIGQEPNTYPGFGVTYIAKVRIIVEMPPGSGIKTIREGCGAGHGIDRDLGQAHESALKESETDARKRALMTFGNQFGLALYDKTQENVVSDPPPVRKPVAPAPNVMSSPYGTFSPPPSPPPKAADEGASSPPPADDAPEQFRPLTESERIALLDRGLDTAARNGSTVYDRMASLKAVWDTISPADQETLRTALERRHKPTARAVQR